ncbi:MAG: alpha/beta hydrolase [Bacteroidetes bacterium]|nr:alpha/beta hydrolase [Bacteroidota bacterium]
MKKYLVLIYLLAAVSGSNAQISLPSWKDINYAGDDKVFHMLDIYLPAEVKSEYPAVVVIYGSGFMSNNLKQDGFKALGGPLLKSGFAVICVNHRSSSDSLFPAQINDIKAAIRFLRAKGKDYQIDTSFIGVTGYSSGGHLSSFTGTSGSVKIITIGKTTADTEGKVGKYLNFSSRVDAVVDWYGPTTFLVMDSCGSEMKHDAADSPESLLVGGPIQQNVDKCAIADPITYVDKNDPPFLILHGDKDPLVPWCQSQRLYDALQKKGVKSEFIVVPGGGHGKGMHIDKYNKMMTDFFLKEASKK